MGLGKTTRKSVKGGNGIERQTRTGMLPSGARYQVNRFKYPEGGTATFAHASKSVKGKSHISVDRTVSTEGGKTNKGTQATKTVRKLGAKAVTESRSNTSGEAYSHTIVSKGRKAKSYASSTTPKGGKTAINYESTPREKKKAMTAVKRMDFNQAKKRGK